MRALRKIKALDASSGDNLRDDYPDIIRGTKENNITEVKEALEIDSSCINNFDESGLTALHWAAYKNNYLISELLFTYPSTIPLEKEIPDSMGRTPMDVAISTGNEKLVTLYMRHLRPEIFNQDDPYDSEKKIIPFSPTDSEP